jgi:hypothetical protein
MSMAGMGSSIFRTRHKSAACDPVVRNISYANRKMIAGCIFGTNMEMETASVERNECSNYAFFANNDCSVPLVRDIVSF